MQRWRARTKVLLDELVQHLELYGSRPSRVRLRRIMRSQDRHVFAAGPDSRRGDLTIAQLYNVVNQGRGR